MKACYVRVTFAALMLLSTTSSLTSAQQSRKPLIGRRVRSETARNAKLEAAINFALNGGVEESGGTDDEEIRYFYNKVDLNGDKQPEVLVYLFGRTMCGTGGCTALVFQSVKGKYKLVADISLARNPIIVSQRRTNGWNDLIMFVVGGSPLPGYYAVWRFDGRKYPDTPTVLRTRDKGTAYLVGNDADKSGVVLRSR